MARIRLKIGENEIEVDSRDFYVDNQTLDRVIDDMSRRLPENPATVTYEEVDGTATATTTAAETAAAPEEQQQIAPERQPGIQTAPARDDAPAAAAATTAEAPAGLELLDEAEAYEPEFDRPVRIAPGEIRSKLLVLQADRFFDAPRTVTETVEQLREYGWAASSLDVSKALASMASSKEIARQSDRNRTRYLVGESLLVCR